MRDSNRRDLWHPEQQTMRGGHPSEGSLSSTIENYPHLTVTPSPKHAGQVTEDSACKVDLSSCQKGPINY